MRLGVDAALKVIVGIGLVAEGVNRHLAEGGDGVVSQHDLGFLDVGVGLAVLQRV